MERLGRGGEAVRAGVLGELFTSTCVFVPPGATVIEPGSGASAAAAPALTVASVAECQRMH